MTNLISVLPTGSRIICDPPPQDTDEDYVWLVHSLLTAINELQSDGYVMSTPYAGTQFTSFRKGETNILVTADKEFYNKFELATKVAKRLNVLDKNNRIALFRAILYGKE